MSVATQDLQAQAPKAPPQPYSGGMNQINAGPAAILYKLSNELIALYNQIQALYSEISIAQTTAQSHTITAAATAQRSSAYMQAWGIGVQGIASLVGAGVSIGTTLAEGRSNLKNFSTLSTQQSELDNLDSLNTLTPRNPNIVIAEENMQPPEVNTTRTSQLRAGTYTFPGQDEGLNPEQIGRRNQQAIDSMEPGEYQEFKANLKQEIATQKQVINTTQSQINYKQQQINTYSQLANSAVGAVSQGTQAIFTNKTGQDQAATQVITAVSQMENSTAEAAKQEITKAFAEVSQTISAARQGANAYANI
jgi:hypothetical protein